MRLIGRSKQILWTDEATPSFFGSRSVSSNVAKQVASHLIKAIEEGNGKQTKVGVAKAVILPTDDSKSSSDDQDDDFTLRLRRLPISTRRDF